MVISHLGGILPRNAGSVKRSRIPTTEPDPGAHWSSEVKLQSKPQQSRLKDALWITAESSRRKWLDRIAQALRFDQHCIGVGHIEDVQLGLQTVFLAESERPLDAEIQLDQAIVISRPRNGQLDPLRRIGEESRSEELLPRRTPRAIGRIGCIRRNIPIHVLLKLRRALERNASLDAFPDRHIAGHLHIAAERDLPALIAE